MSWVSENKFLSGFGAVMLVGMGALGYLASDAAGKLEDEESSYREKRQALNTLQTSSPYPKAENQKKVEAERDKVIDAYRELQAALAAAKVPESDISASAFQQELKRVTDEVLAKADQAGVARSKDGAKKDGRADATKFDLGFDYLSQLPDGDAAKPLGRQLKVIEWLVNMMIVNKVEWLPAINRVPLPEEKRGGKSKPEEPGKKGGKGGKADPSPGLIKKTSFNVSFSANQESVVRVLNDIAACKDQFLVIRKLNISNAVPTPPPKKPVALAAPPVTAPLAVPVPPGAGSADDPEGPAKTPQGTPAPAPPVAKDNSNLTFLLGEELLEVEAEIEILEIEEPAAPKKMPAKKP